MPKPLLLGLLLLLAAACGTNDRPAQKTPVSVPVEHIVPSADQQARRTQSEAYCRAHGVPVYRNPNALFVDSEAQTTLRTQNEVVDRALALCFQGLKSEGLAPAQLAVMDRSYRISAKLTARERAYVTGPQPTEQQRIDAN